MKYLIEIHHGIGDVVQMTGVIDSIHKTDPNGKIALILNKHVYKSLFESDTRVNVFFMLDLVTMSKLEILKEIYKIRIMHFDYLILSPITNYRASRVLALLIGAKVSCGEQLTNRQNKMIHVEPEAIHIVKRNEKLLRSLNFSKISSCPSLLIDNVEMPYHISNVSVGICIGTSIPQKTWALYKYLALADFLMEAGWQVVILGGKKESVLLAGIKLPDSVINLSGKLSLAQTAKVASLCKLVIGGDTGVMHMAAAVGSSTLTLFSCTNPILHCPYSQKSYYYSIHLACQYCYEEGLVAQCKDPKCINEIEVQPVADIALEILNQRDNETYKFVINEKGIQR